MSANRPRLFLTSVLLVTLAFAAAPASGATQTQATDPRWTPWLGCWTAVDAVVCAVPTARPAAVELVTIAKGQIVFREEVDASGTPLVRVREG
jgi:hypothetical protein